MIKRLHTPFLEEDLKNLKVGQQVLVSGTIYTARDAAHARMVALLEEGKELPIALEGTAIYYVGPTPSPKGKVIGSAGPTTAGRMDAYTPLLLEQGLRVMIGKGARNQAVKEAVMKHGAVYLAALGGAGALMAKGIVSCEVVCWEDLGCEAVRRLEVVDLPLTVILDTHGDDLYVEGRQAYLSGRATEGVL